MQSVSPQFITAFTAQDNFPFLRIEVMWGDTQYTLETVNLTAADFSLAGTSSFNGLVTQQATHFGTISLFNKDYRYTPNRASGLHTTIDTELWDYITNMPENGFIVRIYGGFVTTSGQEYTPIYAGRLVDYSYNETTNIVLWTLVDPTWEYLQRKDATVIYSDMDYGELGNAYPIDFAPRSHRTYHAWMDDDSFMNDAFKMSNSSLGYRKDNPSTGHPAFWTADSFFVNNRDVSGLQTPLFFFDPTYSYTDLESRTNVQNRPTEIIVNFSPRYIGTNQVILELDEPLIIAADTTKTFYLKSSQPVYRHTLPVEGRGYAVTSGLGINMKDFVSVSFEFTAQQVIVTMTNTHQYHDGMMRYLVIYGNPVFGSPSGREKKENELSNFKRTRSVGDSFYVQTRAHAKWLTDVLIDRVKYVMPTHFVVDSSPLFLFEVGDLVQYQLLNGSITTKAFISSIKTTYDGERIIQSFSLVDYNYLYPSVEENYFIIGDELDQTKVAFY